MEFAQWSVHLMMLDDGNVEVILRNYLPGRAVIELQKGSYSDYDVAFQELVTLLDASIWSFLATRLVARGKPTLGGYER